MLLIVWDVVSAETIAELIVKTALIDLKVSFFDQNLIKVS